MYFLIKIENFYKFWNINVCKAELLKAIAYQLFSVLNSATTMYIIAVLNRKVKPKVTSENSQDSQFCTKCLRKWQDDLLAFWKNSKICL